MMVILGVNQFSTKISIELHNDNLAQLLPEKNGHIVRVKINKNHSLSAATQITGNYAQYRAPRQILHRNDAKIY